MSRTNDYWNTRIQQIFDERRRQIAADELYRIVYERTYEAVNRLYEETQGQGLTRTQLYRSARFLSWRRDLARQLDGLSGTLNGRMERVLTQAYKDAGLAGKADIGKKTVWTVQNRKMAEACISRKWAGDNFSGRIWKNRGELARTVERGITGIVLTGMGRNELLRELNRLDYRERFHPPDGASQSEIEMAYEAYLQRGRRQADCLVRTELMHTLNTAQIETYRSEGVNWLELDAELTACEKCRGVEAHGPYPIERIPWTIGHPNCRCTWLAVEDEDVEERRQEAERKRAEQNAEKRVDNGAESGIIDSENDVDYMSNSFRPRYGAESVSNVGDIHIPVKRVTNSRFEMYTDVGNTGKNKAVRLTEKNMRRVSEMMDAGFEMPKIVVVDFEKYNFNKAAIGGYNRDINTMFINSKYDTNKKIEEYVNRTKGYFSNRTQYAPYLHELGHKQYEDALEAYAKKNGITVDRARYVIENKLTEYVGDKRKKDIKFIENNISKYANEGYVGHNYSELFAECYSMENKNVFAKAILEILKE